MLREKEKKTLIVLIGLALIMLFTTLYLSTNYSYEENYVVNQNIHVIHVSGDFETNFQDSYTKNSNNIGEYDIETYNSLLKSSDVTPQIWNKIATSIGSVYDNYDAFVIIHGKDTLTYTASALSFMLENLSKPVIFTDGEVVSALLLASKHSFPEVCVESKGVLLRACRTISYSDDDYFTSPNYPVLTNETSFSLPKDPFQIKFINPKINVVVIKIHPGMDLKYLEKMSQYTGIVLETYGVGNSPTSKKFLEIISSLVKNGVVIVNVSQSELIKKYNTDINLLKAGVLAGNDMTTYAIFCKLYYLLSNVKDKKLINQLMEKSFRGEI
jgi:L-asparaginase